jgi:hypothetical protein
MRYVILFATVAAFSTAATGSVYPTGYVWDRSADWSPGQLQNAGYQFGNPAPDQNGSPAWAYEQVSSGSDLGNAHPWFEGQPIPLRWDSSWFDSGVQVWAFVNDIPPAITLATLQHSIQNQDEYTRVPMVRWTNPTGAACTVHIEGDLTLRWSGNQNLGTSVQIAAAIVLVTREGQYTKLFAETYDDPSPGDQNIGVKNVPINLAGVEVEPGDSLLITVRGSKEVAGRWCDMNDNLKITLTEIDGGCTPDIDGNGVLDLFDFLAFVNLFNAGC